MKQRIVMSCLLITAQLVAGVCCAMENDDSYDHDVFNDKLYAAARCGQEERVRFLVEDCGANPNAHHPMRLGETPLHAAIRSAKAEVTRILIEEFQVNCSAQDEAGKTPLHLAVELGNRDMVRLLLERFSVDVSVADTMGETPLHIAVNVGSKVIVRKLIKAGASSDAGDRYRQTPLYQACAHGFKAAVCMMIGAYADPNCVTYAPHRRRGQRSMTPLMVAIRRLREKVVRMLLVPEVGVNLEACNDAGETVLNIAQAVAGEGYGLGTPYGTRAQKILFMVQEAVRQHELVGVRGRLYEDRNSADAVGMRLARLSLPRLDRSSSDSIDASESALQFVLLPRIESHSSLVAHRRGFGLDEVWEEVGSIGDNGVEDEFPTVEVVGAQLPMVSLSHS